MSATDSAGRRAGRQQLTDQVLARFYWLAAACLAPWIVILFFTQSPLGRAYDLTVTVVGITSVSVIGLLVTAVLCVRHSWYLVLAATLTATVTFITGWFHVVTRIGTLGRPALVSGIVASVAVVGLCSWTAIEALRSRGVGLPMARWVPLVLVVGVAVLAPLLLRHASVTAPTEVGRHLRLAWTGLDLFELSGLVATAWNLRRHPHRVTVTATVTGTLLFCDAWFNVLTTRGPGQAAALAMCLVELPVAGLSFWVAIREVRRWRAQVGPGVVAVSAPGRAFDLPAPTSGALRPER